MALPSLALGIGLQGKYDYKQQANLQLARERGRAKAEADAAAAAAKKRAPYEKRLLNIRGEGLLPVHAKAIREKVGEALTYFEENPEDYQGISQRIYDIDSSSKAYKNQSDLVKKTQSSSYLRGDADAVSGIMSSDDPDAIEEALSMNPSTGIRYDKASNNFAIAPTKYIDSKLRIDNILQKGGNNYYAPSEDAKVIDVNGKKFTTFQLNPQVPSLVLNEMLSGDNLASANDDYYSYLKSKRMALPDLRTPEGLAEWEGGRNKFLMDDITSEFEARGLIKDVTPSKGSTFIFNPPGAAADTNINGVSGGDLVLKYTRFSKEPQYATPQSQAAAGNFNATLANTSRTFNMNTGEPIDRAQVKDVKFNEMAVFYVLKKDYGDLSAGMIVPNSFLKQARQAGMVEPQILAYGLQEGPGGKSIYLPVSKVALTQIMESSPKDRPTIEYLQKTLKEKSDSLSAGAGTTPNPTSPTPKPAEKPKSTPKPAGNSKSVVEDNAGSNFGHKISGGAAVVKKKEQVAKDVEKATGVPLRTF